ncbi:MAG TPA: hypothetical protein VIK91_06460 [Nannocystis sp.]
MPSPALLRALMATACALPILATTSCKEEEGPTTLFDEEGAWKLLYFKLEDGDQIGGFGSTLRQGKYMVYFDKTAKIVAAASCKDSAGDSGVLTSSCDLPKEEGGYVCRCFTYEFEDDRMTWIENEVDGQPPPPQPTDKQLDEGVKKPGDPIVINLAAYDPDNFNNTWRFQPLPYGLFDSNGLSSEFVFQAVSPMVFDGTTGCREVCGIAPAPTE